MEESEKDKIYREYNRKVFFYIKGKGIGDDDAEDLCANIFVKVYKNIDNFDSSKSSISTWIYRITQNSVIDFYRSRRQSSELSEEIEYVDDGFEKSTQTETLTELGQALMKLDERSRCLVVLVYYDDMTLKAAAEKISMSYSNAKIVMKKALASLKEFLE